MPRLAPMTFLTRSGPPNSSSVLIRLGGRPGIATHMSRGRLMAAACREAGSIITTIIVSVRQSDAWPRWSLPSRMMFSVLRCGGKAGKGASVAVDAGGGTGVVEGPPATCARTTAVLVAVAVAAGDAVGASAASELPGA